MRTLVMITLLLVATASSILPGNFVNGSQTCPSSGNKRVSSTQYNLYQLTVTSLIANTGRIYFGGSTVSTSDGAEVLPGGSYNAVKPSAGTDPGTLYFACTSSADSLTWIGQR